MSGKRIAAGTLALLVTVALGLSGCAEPVGYAAPGYVDYGYPDGWVDGWGHWGHGRGHWDHGGWGHGFAHGHSGFGHGGFAGHGGGHGGGGGHGR